MSALGRGFQGLPPIGRFAAVGAVLFGIAGAIVGLVQGLLTYIPTAWAALFEVAIPAALVGAMFGVLAWWVLRWGRALRGGGPQADRTRSPQDPSARPS